LYKAYAMYISLETTVIRMLNDSSSL